ncbi:hypothetical protein D3C84_1294170 [compost metagenome]
MEIELQPPQNGVAGRVTVTGEGMGQVRLGFLSLGLEIEVFSHDEEVPFERLWFDADTLQSPDPDEEG